MGSTNVGIQASKEHCYQAAQQQPGCTLGSNLIIAYGWGLRCYCSTEPTCTRLIDTNEGFESYRHPRLGNISDIIINDMWPIFICIFIPAPSSINSKRSPYALFQGRTGVANLLFKSEFVYM